MNNYWLRKRLYRYRCFGKHGCNLWFENKDEFLSHKATIDFKQTKEEKELTAAQETQKVMKERPLEV